MAGGRGGRDSSLYKESGSGWSEPEPTRSSCFPLSPGASLYPFSRKEAIPPPAVVIFAVYSGVRTSIVRSAAWDAAESPRWGLPPTAAGPAAAPCGGAAAGGTASVRLPGLGGHRRVVLPRGRRLPGRGGKQVLIYGQDGDRENDRQHYPFFVSHRSLFPKMSDLPRLVDAARVEGVAPEDPPDPVQAPEEGPVQADRSHHVLGAAGVEPAAVPEIWRYRQLVEFQHADEEIPRPHGRSFKSGPDPPTACGAREAAPRTRRPAQDLPATSGPRWPCASPRGNASLFNRYSSRRRRFIRLRTTEPPARFPADTPTCLRSPPRASRYTVKWSVLDALPLPHHLDEFPVRAQALFGGEPVPSVPGGMGHFFPAISTVRCLRPFARRRARTFRPAAVDMRSRKPWVRFRRRLCG